MTIESATAPSTVNARNTPTAEERAALEKKRQDALESVNPSTPKQSILAEIDEDSFGLKLSKHLADFRRGEGYLSRDVAGSLYTRSGKAASILAAEDPRAASQYNAYSTGFDYESKARFIQGVSQTASTASTLRDLSKRLNRTA